MSPFNGNAAEQAIERRTDLHQLLGLMRSVLLLGRVIPADGKYANSTACLAALARGYHDSLAAMDLCFFSQYVQARGLLRSIYEAGSIARTFAHSPKLAEKWMRGEWQPDQKARQFVANVMFADKPVEEQSQAKADYDEAYGRLSSWAHITTMSTLGYIEDLPDGGYTVQLEPEYNEETLESTLDALELEVLYLTFAARNSLNYNPASLPSEWYKIQEEIAAKIAPTYTPSGADWDSHDATRERMFANLRPNSLLNRDLKKSSTSYANLTSDESTRTELR
ncbi:hypothetical protein CIK58_15825 [Brevibacterium aurantiacum]|uniref:hypothetical protein n=1 Tax=Brevibacterium aurantiacum TaxID=273384 RepID=UPI000BB96E51|nr:hypothetical protein [Brevibacterium aurantiacum]PCC55940.1 hypothetical protein CIK58_15825 [Brevibacterium aurantiacum]